MQFFQPVALAWLLLVPVLVLLYFMKLRRRDQLVSAGFLWQRAARQARVDSFFQRLRINVLLILQVLALVLLALASARPWVAARDSLPAAIVFVLDASASMQATEGGRARFDHARERALSACRDALPGTRFMLIRATTRARVDVPLTTDREAVVRALDGATPADTSTDLKPAMLLALAVCREYRDARVFLLTDRDVGGPGLPQEVVWADRVRYIPVGLRARNVAITAFDARALARGEGFEVFARVDNESDEPADGFLELHRGDALVDARELHLAARRGTAAVFRLAPGGSERVEARLVVHDDLAVDNRAFTVLPAAQKSRVLLVSAGNPFLERVLPLLEGIRVFRTSASEVPAAGEARLVVWDGSCPPAEATGHHLVINLPAGAPWLEPGAEIALDAPVSFEQEHPLFRYVDLAQASLASARQVRVPSWGKVLARSGGHPLVVLLERPGLQALVLCFDPARTDLPLSPAFPILLANAVEFLGGGGVRGAPVRLSTEQSLSLDFFGRPGDVTVRGPDGTRRVIAMKTLSAADADTDRAGFYAFSQGDRAFTVGVNLLDRRESDLTPPRTAERAPSAMPGSGGGLEGPAAREVWWAFVGVALLVLLVEWYAWCRGT